MNLKRNKIVEIFQFENKEPHWILLQTRNLQTKEKKIIKLRKGTLIYPFLKLFKIRHALPSNLHLVQTTEPN